MLSWPLVASELNVAAVDDWTSTWPLFRSVPAFGLLTAACPAGGAHAGQHADPLARVFDPSIPWADNVDAQIFFIARLPRVLAGALVGSTLAAAGVVLQALLRNPLATPFTLGVSAECGARRDARHRFGPRHSARFGAAPCRRQALPGRWWARAAVYFLATRLDRRLSTNVLLLAGVTLNTFFSALITIVQYLIDLADWYRTARWLIGNLDVSSFSPIWRRCRSSGASRSFCLPAAAR